MTEKVKIKEIFASIQGEGPFIGYKQLFIRFCGCNLNCEYCDTDFDAINSEEYSYCELADIVNNYKDCHSVSLTGGEPLLHVEFLNKFLPMIDKPIYLETNATLFQNLVKIIDFVDYVSADIKLPSCTGLKPHWEEHQNFFETAISKTLFAKVVFDQNITDDEVENCISLAQKYNIELVLQPRMLSTGMSITNVIAENVLDKFLAKYPNVRLIPQVHKFIDVR